MKRGFSWPGFFFSYLWAFSKGLWLQGLLFIFVQIAVVAWEVILPLEAWPLPIVAGVIVALWPGFKGNFWRRAKLEKRGYQFLGIVAARSASAAIALGVRQSDSLSRVGQAKPAFLSLPRWSQRLFAVVWLTWKAAFRYRLFLVITTLLLLSVVGLPLLIKDDGTARGFTQILLTYTLSVITALLGISTLWLSCGTLARDIEECQMQVVAVKPIARWQIWIGKWLGILSLNAALIAISGSCVYGLLQWRARHLPAREQEILRNEVLVARGSLKEKSILSNIEAEVEARLKDRIAHSPVTGADLNEVRKQIRERLVSEYQIVPSRAMRPWEIDLGFRKNILRNQPLQLRVKFNAAQKSPSGTFAALWQVGTPQKTPIWQSERMSLAPDTFHEFTVPPNLFDDDGVLRILFVNTNDSALLFSLEEGMEVLYREGGFGLNFIRALTVIFCWMALLSAIGLAAATFLSFPVASFSALAILGIALSSGTLASVVSEGTIMSTDEKGRPGYSALDAVMVPTFRALLNVIKLARDFSPIDLLSSGRSISWGQLGHAFFQIVVVLGGVFVLFGIFVFSRRELATAQGNQ